MSPELCSVGRAVIIFVGGEIIGRRIRLLLRSLLESYVAVTTVTTIIYENGKFARMALINYMTDPSGANDYLATIYVGGSGFKHVPDPGAWGLAYFFLGVAGLKPPKSNEEGWETV